MKPRACTSATRYASRSDCSVLAASIMGSQRSKPSTYPAPRSTSILQKRPSPHPQSSISRPSTLPQASSIGGSSNPLRVEFRPSLTSLTQAGDSSSHSRLRSSLFITIAISLERNFPVCRTPASEFFRRGLRHETDVGRNPLPGPTLNGLLTDFSKAGRDFAPAELLPNQPGRVCPQPLRLTLIFQNADHGTRESFRRVGHQNLPPVIHGQPFGTNRSGDNGFFHGHRLINFDPRAPADAERDDVSSRAFHMGSDVLDAPGDDNRRVTLAQFQQAGERASPDHGQSHFRYGLPDAREDLFGEILNRVLVRQPVHRAGEDQVVTIRFDLSARAEEFSIHSGRDIGHVTHAVIAPHRVAISGRNCDHLIEAVA